MKIFGLILLICLSALQLAFAFQVGNFFFLATQIDSVVRTETSGDDLDIIGQEVGDTLTLLSRHLLFDAEEEHTIAVVKHPEDLIKKNAEFYKDVEKGDNLIVFTDRVILYRPSLDRIVNISQTQ